jgi:hypothetical protein
MRRVPGWSVLPRRFGWLRALLRPEAQGPMVGSHYLLQQPEMKAIMAAAPQVGRILRPFCHLLGIETPAELVLPKRRRVRTRAPALSAAGEAELARITAPFPDTPAARKAKLVWRRVIAGKKVDLRTLPAVVAGICITRHGMRTARRRRSGMGGGRCRRCRRIMSGRGIRAGGGRCSLIVPV